MIADIRQFGRWPQRKKNPTEEDEHRENALAKRLANLRDGIDEDTMQELKRLGDSSAGPESANASQPGAKLCGLVAEIVTEILELGRLPKQSNNCKTEEERNEHLLAKRYLFHRKSISNDVQRALEQLRPAPAASQSDGASQPAAGSEANAHSTSAAARASYRNCWASQRV